MGDGCSCGVRGEVGKMASVSGAAEASEAEAEDLGVGVWFWFCDVVIEGT